MSLSPPVFLFAAFVFFLVVYNLLRRRCRPPENEKRRLPPGSMGWPYIGETLNLYTQNPNIFFSTRQNRHGKMFKSHILGCPCVMISSPEVAKIILYSYAVAVISVFGKKMEVEEMEGLKELYHCIEKGYNSMPLDLPGTPFNKAMKARKLLNERLRKMIQKRRENRDDGGGLLGVLLGLKGKEQLNDSQIADNIIGVIFAAHDTTASVLTWLLKYLHDHPHLLDAVKMEQEDIKCKRLETNRGITWDDTRNMPLTNRFLQETLRAASILSFTFREAVEDVEIEGYLIPRGWKVLPLFRTIHYCSDFFPDPNKFNPSRFEVAPRANTFLPFGNGAHSCPGSELAKVEILILLHYLTTSFRWDVVGEDDGIQYGPFPVPKEGLPIKLHRLGET